MLRRVVCCLVVIHELENWCKVGSGWVLRAVVGNHAQSLKSQWREHGAHWNGHQILEHVVVSDNLCCQG
jgi:hypothetical protein